MTNNTVTVDTATGGRAAVSFGVNLLIKHEVGVHHCVEWDIASDNILSANTIAECQMVAPDWNVLMEHACKRQMVVAVFINKIGCCRECCLEIDTACRVVFVVFRVVDDACLELGDVAAAFLVIADDAALAIHLVERHLVVILLDIQAFKVVVVITQTDSVIQIFDVADLLLHAHDGTELSAVHVIETRCDVARVVDGQVARILAFDDGQVFHKR